MGTIYAVVNQKGGVGKTTTAVNVAAFIALSGVKTLLVDLDPQGNTTSGLGVDRRAVKKSAYDVLIDDMPVREAMIETKVANLLLLPATMDMAGADIELMPKISRETYLADGAGGRPG